MKIVAITDRGLVKENNEDSYVINDKHYYNENLYLEEPGYLFAVLDGVGGSNAGEVASLIGSKMLANNSILFHTIAEEQLQNFIAEINDKIVEESLTKKQFNGMATTLIGIAIQGDVVVTFNAGDSRLYRLRSGILKQISYDDSYPNALKEMGREVPEGNKKYLNNHMITFYLGNKNFNKEDIHINYMDFGIKSHDIFILCSDGVTDLITDLELQDFLEKDITIIEKANSIKDCVISRGAQDNFTYIIIEN